MVSILASPLRLNVSEPEVQASSEVKNAQALPFGFKNLDNAAPARAISLIGRDPCVKLGAGSLSTLNTDGARCTVRKSCWPAMNERRHRVGLGLVAEIPVTALRVPKRDEAFTRYPCIFFGLVPWGFGWSFPKGDVLSVGVGGLMQPGLDLGRRLVRIVEAVVSRC